ncbi:helix-turn-helix domain-containing protein [Ammoniphilus sp. 3BR4]|uniref:helix-turn-helix domain-containing protein n=1 Tax=Ammoniphilus sp. 3BR4 TaxID=3158265 RepID=UPI00346650F1
MSNATLISQFLKMHREMAKISQAAIGREGFMHQSTVSLIERGKLTPTLDDLRYFSKKYGVPLEEMLPMLDEHNQSLGIEQYETKGHVLLRMEACVQEEKYADLEKWYRMASSNPAFKNPVDQPFLDWVQAILYQELYHDFEKADCYLRKATTGSEATKRTDRMTECINSLGVLLIHEGKLEKALPTLQEALAIIESLPLHTRNKCFMINARILYNLAVVSYQQDNFQDTHNYSQQTRAISKQHNSFYLMGEATYYDGISYYYDGNIEKAHSQLHSALYLFEASEKDHYKTFTENKLIELKLTEKAQSPRD